MKQLTTNKKGEKLIIDVETPVFPEEHIPPRQIDISKITAVLKAKGIILKDDDILTEAPGPST